MRALKRQLTVTCPTCRAEVAWSESSRWRPFCSARCRGLDLGDWASERFVIVGEGSADGAVEPVPITVPKPD